MDLLAPAPGRHVYPSVRLLAPAPWDAGAGLEGGDAKGEVEQMLLEAVHGPPVLRLAHAEGGELGEASLDHQVCALHREGDLAGIDRGEQPRTLVLEIQKVNESVVIESEGIPCCHPLLLCLCRT